MAPPPEGAACNSRGLTIKSPAAITNEGINRFKLAYPWIVSIFTISHLSRECCEPLHASSYRDLNWHAVVVDHLSAHSSRPVSEPADVSLHTEQGFLMTVSTVS